MAKETGGVVGGVEKCEAVMDVIDGLPFNEAAAVLTHVLYKIFEQGYGEHYDIDEQIGKLTDIFKNIRQNYRAIGRYEH